MTRQNGHRRDAEATRARIIKAAQLAFSERAYGDNGIRHIAEIAETSSTLLLHYFGSKLGLFEAALEAAIPIPEALTRPRSEFAALFAAALLKPGKPIIAEAMLALAMGDKDAAEVATRIIEERGVRPLAAWLGQPDARLRALQIGMLTNGAITYLKQLPMQDLSKRDYSAITTWFIDSIQAIVDKSNT